MSNIDPYARAMAWEKEQALVQSLPWVWLPRDEKSGTMSCTLERMPEGQTPESLKAMIESHDPVFKVTLLKTPSGQDSLNIALVRLMDFENSYMYCYRVGEATESVRGQGNSILETDEKKSPKDFRYELSHKGNDIYVFCRSLSQAQELIASLGKKDIKSKGVTFPNTQNRVNIPISEQKKLEALGCTIHPYARKGHEVAK